MEGIINFIRRPKFIFKFIQIFLLLTYFALIPVVLSFINKIPFIFFFKIEIFWKNLHWQFYENLESEIGTTCTKYYYGILEFSFGNEHACRNERYFFEAPLVWNSRKMENNGDILNEILGFSIICRGNWAKSKEILDY